MRVVVDARYLCERYGSMTVYCTNLLRALVELDPGQKPVALVPRELDPSAVPLRDELGSSLRWETPEVDRYGSGDLAGELRWVHQQVPALLKERVQDADVLISVYHHPPFRAPGVHKVAIVHDLCGLGSGFPKYKKAFWRHYLRLRAAAHMSDSIWPISAFTRDAMSARFRSARRRMGPVVYNGVDRASMTVSRQGSFLATHGLEGQDYLVAFATRQERKNFAITLAALRVLSQRGHRLRLVGISPGWESDDVRAWCAREGLEDAIILSGIPDEELDACYSGALALSWPSTCEGFGYPVVEAMAQGCPPLVWSVGPGAELIGGAIDPLSSLDASAIAERLIALRALHTSDRAELARRLKERADEFALARYAQHLRAALNLSDRAS